MRLDKFLKVSRLVKQRQRAKTICDSGSARINGRVEKAGAQVKAGDFLEIVIGNRQISAVILSVPAGNVSKSDAAILVDIKKETILDEGW
ncbi:RNA-binding S4 domain-containing protein [bacterium]|nr:RNA-binding S4 domain-containing protein [candidate division CSSED10-310 bacterium]